MNRDEIPDRIERLQVSITGDKPMEIVHAAVQGAPGPTDAQKATVHQLGTVIKAYLDALRGLLEGKYANIKDWAPAHLADPGNVVVIVCPDGAVIRFERKTEAKKRVIAAWASESLSELTRRLSQNLIHCYTDRNFTSTIAKTGTELKLFKESRLTNATEEVGSVRVGFDAVIERPERLPTSPQKPFCLLSVRNEVELQTFGLLTDESAKLDEGQRFMARSIIRLPVGWECIEVYPFFDPVQWQPEYAGTWAENDLLATVLGRQFREAQLQALDPNAAARREYSRILKSYKDLLDSNPEREEVLQSFLRDYPFLLCPTQSRVWPKLALGAHATDFVFREAAGDYLLVELERSTHRLFLRDGHPSRELNHARGQVVDWKRYLEDNLSTVQRELGLDGISASPKRLIVIGRSCSLTSQNRRKLASMENESPCVKIMTYDDVFDNAKAVVENLLGPIWDVVGNTEIYYLGGT